MSLHTGCHVESALHCIEEGESIDQVDLERVIGSAVVLDLTPVEEEALIDVPDLERARERLESQQESIRPGDILLLRTDWAERAIGTSRYFPLSPGLTQDAARWLVERHPKCIGCDSTRHFAAQVGPSYAEPHVSRRFNHKIAGFHVDHACHARLRRLRRLNVFVKVRAQQLAQIWSESSLP